MREMIAHEGGGHRVEVGEAVQVVDGEKCVIVLHSGTEVCKRRGVEWTAKIPSEIKLGCSRRKMRAKRWRWTHVGGRKRSRIEVVCM